MTDPVDTDALRAFAAESGGSPASLTMWGMTSATLHRATADEVDRLRAVIENAPHAEDCRGALVDSHAAWTLMPGECTCWKADAL